MEPFVAEYFGEPHRRVLLIGGAGFDPRSLTVAKLLLPVLGNRLDALFIRERRPSPSPSLRERAEAHLAELQRLIPSTRVVDVKVFESDGAVVLGRRLVEEVRYVDMSRYTDVIVDFSALSVGSSFPVTRLLLTRIEAEDETGDTISQRLNLHAMVTARPTTDDRIVPAPSSIVGPVHGFPGRFGLDETARAAKLWLPQLRFGQRGILERLYDYLRPDDVVPVLPFPSDDPRIGDRLIEHYAAEFDSRWSVDARSIVYADERSPLDFYRTVLRIDDGRHPVFAESGGSLLILSPVGSKVLALGGMMAAVERDLPVVYVEALSYTADLQADEEASYLPADVVHVWLLGEAYPRASSDAANRNAEVSSRMIQHTGDHGAAGAAAPPALASSGAADAAAVGPVSEPEAQERNEAVGQ
ncbi:MAG: hypothetical protein WEF86_12225 [Gemmatimonadota bacterium]